jgi:hypothetical protein
MESSGFLKVQMNRKEYDRHIAIINKYNNQSITIVKHNRSGKDEVHEGMIQANPWGVNTGNPAQPVAGGYDFLMKTPNGGTAIPTIDPLNSSVQYNPRAEYIKKLYLETNGLNIFQYKFAHAAKGSLAQELTSGPSENAFGKLAPKQ